LFIGKNTLVVEGPSDLIYLQTFSDHLKAAGRPHLDARWTICPVGGIDKVAAFMSLFGANHLNIVTLVDVGAGQKRKVEELDRLTRVLRRGSVLTAATYAGQAEADIEDIIGAQGYLDLVNDFYGFMGKEAIALPAGSYSPVRVTKLVEEVMRLRVSAPPYDHLQAALHLMENRSLMGKLTNVTEAFKRFERLFLDINMLVAK
jgi:OLD-like protein